MRNEHWISFSTSAVLSLMTFLFGAEYYLLKVLLFFMAIDFVTGIMASIATGKGLCSSLGFTGLIKKFAILCILAVTHQIDVLLGTSIAMLGAIYFYSALELISITENCGKLGVPMPQSIKNAITMLKSKEVDFNESKNVESQVHGHEVPFDEAK